MKMINIDGKLLSNPEGINKVIQSIKSMVAQALAPIELICVTGEENLIQDIQHIAEQSRIQDFDYTASLKRIEAKYLDLIRNVLPVTNQSAVLSHTRKRFNELDDFCKGIQLLGECPLKTIKEIRIFPALILASIFTAACNAQGVSAALHTAQPMTGEQFEGLNIMAEDGETAVTMTDAITSKTTSIEIWSSSYPLYTADPACVKNAKPILALSYEEAMELSRQDRTILHPGMLGKAFAKKVPIRIRAMHLEETATTLISDTPKQELKAITGIASMNRIALVRIEGSGMIGVPGFAQRVFASLNQQRINVILISQDASEHALCFAVKQSDEQKALEQMKQEFATEIEAEVLQPIRSAGEVSIIGLVGESMRNHPGVSGRMFSALGRNGINILAIAQGSNERTISAVVRSADLVKAINVLHEAFFEDSKREINLYVVGTGNVGKKLIGQLANQLQQMEETANIRLNLAGICNSKKMLIDNQIDPAQWDQMLGNKGEKNNLDLFTETIIKLNRRNSVLVDVTASEIPPNYYERLLKKSVSVVACNKIAAASSYPFYHNLKQLAVSYNCKFLFETNVGAALPIIGTLNDLLKSGDRIKKIEAVLSGTLNYVFNNYDGNKPFAEVVRDAQREGYTEPDPRLDLSGKDVMRKIMILARETGEKMEMEEISCNSFLPESCMQGSVEEFYQEMGRHEDHFRQLLEAARSDQSTLKFVARYENGKASVGLQHIKPESEMFHLYGKDNIVLFYTERYTDQPLVVKGAGAGAEVTASGVFADIIRTINN